MLGPLLSTAPSSQYGMSRAARRLLAQPPFKCWPKTSARSSGRQYLCSRPLSNTTGRKADEKDFGVKSSPTTPFTPVSTNREPQSAENSPSTAADSVPSTLSNLANIFGSNQEERTKRRDPFLDIARYASIGGESPKREDQFEEPHHFHVYSTKHNTHITLTRPNREPIMSYSAGNLGFRKAARKHYDSAFQLASYVMGKIQEQGINAKITKLEVMMRGFGAGREAVTKAFLGNEGRFLRGKVVKVSDSTRIKFGGTRSKKPRRLG